MSVEAKVELDLDAELARAKRHFDAGEYVQTEQICRRLLQRYPAQPRVLNQLAETTHRAGAPAVAIALARRAISLDPNVAAFHQTLGGALLARGQAADAEAALRRSLELDPDNSPAIAKLASTLVALGRLAEAHDLMRAAVARNPEDALLRQAEGVVLWALARPADARVSFLRAGELAPRYFHSTSGALFAQHYIPAVDAEAVAAEARRWGQEHSEKLTRAVEPHRNQPHPNRRLRIGYISGDFRTHPVGRILQSVLPFHDPSQVEVYCYSNHWAVDDVTRRLQAGASTWRSIVHLNDEATAELIRADQIDILVDLSGHTADGRLLALARKPAPIQMMWLGYFDTTGMSAIDYVIADRHVCPPGDERFYVEKVARLPHSFVCFTPPDPSPDVVPPPALGRGYVTFGCQNNVSKVTSEVIALWARILRENPEAHLALKAVALNDPAVCDRYLSFFHEGEIAAERVHLSGGAPYAEYLSAYGEIDIALDPFPYNGGHTTLDALWMGVPVIALRGQRFVGRMGASILATAGMSDFIAESADEYVAKAGALARDLDRLVDLRARQRERLVASPLGDGRGIAHALENIYREAWQVWCQSAGLTAAGAVAWPS